MIQDPVLHRTPGGHPSPGATPCPPWADCAGGCPPADRRRQRQLHPVQPHRRGLLDCQQRGISAVAERSTWRTTMPTTSYARGDRIGGGHLVRHGGAVQPGDALAQRLLRRLHVPTPHAPDAHAARGAVADPARGAHGAARRAAATAGAGSSGREWGRHWRPPSARPCKRAGRPRSIGSPPPSRPSAVSRRPCAWSAAGAPCCGSLARPGLVCAEPDPAHPAGPAVACRARPARSALRRAG